MKLTNLILCSLTLLTAPALAQQRHAMTFDDLIALQSVSDPQISPDGKWVAFVATENDLKGNAGNSDIWVVPSAGGDAVQLTNSPKGDSQPRWAPDGGQLAFVSSRGGSPQIYLIDPRGGEARKLSDVKTGITNLTWAPNGRTLAFTGDVAWPPKAEGAKEDPFPSDALIFDHLFYRHWDEWRVGTRSHLFVIPAEGGEAKDLTPIDKDVPTLALGGAVDIAYSPDSKQIAFVMNPDENPATGTNNDVFVISLDWAAVDMTEQNKANDHSPVFSPDGSALAYLAHERAGFEADRNHLMLLDLKSKTRRDLTPDWGLSVGEMVWSADGKALFAIVQEELRNVIYRISVESGERTLLFSDGHYGTLRISPDGKTLVATRESATQPDEVYALDLASHSTRQLSHVNEKRLAALEMNPVEPFWYTGAKGEKVEGLLVKPPGFDASKKYPFVYLIHGGPQGAWNDSFSARWNYQMFAAPGYVVAAVNFHGSTGYGQDFTDSISRHWGDYPYEDVMKGVDYVVGNYPFVDGSRVAAAGASYGGYMINWIATHNDRFKALVCHDGVFDLESMYGETEELWFPEWEFGGMPWNSREIYRKWSPSVYEGNLKTPMLVIHGQRDYRVDVSQGFELFTALQRQGVESRFVYFPDEGHWVLKPRDRRLWWREVLGWIGKYLEQAGEEG